MVDPPAGLPGLEVPQRQEEQRHPLDCDRKRPRHAGEHGPARCRKRERGEDEDHHPGVVVAPSRKVNGEQRIPADECRRERRAARKPCSKQDEGNHGRRGQASVEPRRCVRRRPDDGSVRLGCEREPRPVDGGRLVPAGAHERIGDVRRVVGGLVDVGVATVLGRDAGVVPVRVDVGREHDRARERDQLDRAGERDHGFPERATRGPAQQIETGEVRGERGDHRAEVEPRPLRLVPLVLGNERRGRRIGEGDRGRQ